MIKVYKQAGTNWGCKAEYRPYIVYVKNNCKKIYFVVDIKGGACYYNKADS